jgi:hypothetical protein
MGSGKIIRVGYQDYERRLINFIVPLAIQLSSRRRQRESGLARFAIRSQSSDAGKLNLNADWASIQTYSNHDAGWAKRNNDG